MAIMSNFPYRRLRDAGYFLYGFILSLLVLVLLLGNVRLGAQRWLKILWFNFQPSEMAKLAVVIFLARYFSHKGIQDINIKPAQFGLLRGLIIPFAFVSLPVFLVNQQPDLGSAIMLLFIFIIMLYFARVKLRYLIGFFLIVLFLLPVIWHFLRDYQKERLLVFINPNIDPLGAGYTIIQSKIAIGSGKIFGKGWLLGTQSQLKFLPEGHTDFILATFLEEWGFLGAMLLLALYYALIKCGLDIATATRDDFGRLLSSGITAMFAVQILINIFMNIGFLPVVGLPLILMSYGGSSLLITFIASGILMNINKTRSIF
jgi:rod shape determining protein RodA